MAQVVFNIPDDKEQRFIDVFAVLFNWNKDSGITKKQFMKSKIKEYMKGVVYRAEVAEANRIAAQTLQEEIDTIDVT